MKIRFETTIEHIIAYHRFHYGNSPAWRRQRLMLTLILPLLIALTLLAQILLNEQEQFEPLTLVVAGLAALVLSGIASVPWWLFVRWFMTVHMVSMARKFLAEGSNRTILGWREIELVGHRLQVNTELIQASYDLRAIEKIVGNDEYTFVYYSSIQAFVIPMNLYPEEEYREFVVALRRAWENREAPPLERDAARQPPDVRIAERPM